MKRIGARKRMTVVALVVTLVAVGVLFVRTAAPATAATSAHADTTTTSTTDPSTSGPSAGLVTAGPSRSECLTLNTVPSQSGLTYVESLVSSFDSLTNSTVTCISAYVIGTQTWSQWIHPWVVNSEPGYSEWVAKEPQTRQLVIAMNLIPNGLANVKNPLRWEKSCAAGAYDSYARQFATNLVSAGLENSVIRLGPEMNGVWEDDFIGNKKIEQTTWAKCFAKEVTSMRQVSGQHFLMDWNVNACVGNYPYPNFYPGNAYVDIMGLDLYDVGCLSPTTSLTFAQLASERAGLDHFEAFAASKGKPMSLPEWGLASIPSGDDPAYINGIGATVTNGDFAFETYYDQAGPNLKALPLSSSTPRSVAAFQTWFGGAPKSGSSN